MQRLFLILILLICSPCFASAKVDIYQSQLSVATQSVEDRDKVTPEILEAVIAKVVGDSQALKSTDISALLANAKQYVQYYQYHQMNKISDDLTEPEHLQLEIGFKENELNDALSKLNLPIWGKLRPDILLWLVIDKAGQRTIQGEDDYNQAIPKLMKKLANNRGLTLFLPLMDLQDQTQIKASDIWMGTTENIVQVSKRYNPSAIVLARVVEKNNKISIRWQSILNNEVELWQSEGNQSQALQEGVTQLTDRISRRFSQAGKPQFAQSYAMQISNVNDFSDYIRVKNYLSKIHYVKDVELKNLSNGQLDITLSLTSELSIFDETIAVGDVLKKDDTHSSSEVINYKLVL